MKAKTSLPIALVDDHTLVRKGLAELIDHAGGYRVVLQASNGRELLKELEHDPAVSIVIVDLNMPVMDGYQTITWLRDNRPDIRTLALTFDGTEDAVIKAMKSGARGFILKDIEPAELKNALDHIATTGYYHTDLVHHSIIDGVDRRSEYDRELARILAKISAREMEFLQMICSSNEYTYERIAEVMGIHRRTVDGYRESLFTKFNLHTKAGLVVFALKWGIVRL